MSKRLSVILPCYNEEPVIRQSIDKLSGKLASLIDAGTIDADSMIIAIDDGSTDDTWNAIAGIASYNRFVVGIKLTHNVGQQNALIAGLETAIQKDADITITIDADLQDDINAIDKMLELHSQGCEIVYGVRNDRSSDSWFKRVTARMFYNFMKATQAKIIPNHSDYRLMSRRAVEMLLAYEERNLFLRGIVPLIGLKSERVYYSRTPRHAGYTKYPLGKMLSFAIEGITSFSVRPIRR